MRRPDPVPEPVDPQPVPPGALGVQARALSVRYPDAGVDALAGLDLTVAPGTRVVVTGASGSGKSTLAAACLRFLEPASGSLELVGPASVVDLSRASGSAVREAVGLCEQDPHIFDATLADNLRLARPGAPDSELEQALAAARLLDWVRALPDGLATTVGEHGARLSGGQRQRIALARALLADVRVLILDEPTEHLDEPTARAFIRDLESVIADRTLLVLTHRPELFDRPGWIYGPELGRAVPQS